MKVRGAPESKVEKAVEGLRQSLLRTYSSRIKKVDRSKDLLRGVAEQTPTLAPVFRPHPDSSQFLLAAARCRQEELERKKRLADGASILRDELKKGEKEIPADARATFLAVAQALHADKPALNLIDATFDLLGSNLFRVRELASAALLATASLTDRDPWVTKLIDGEKNSNDLEIRYRAKAVLLRTGDFPSPSPKNLSACLRTALVAYEEKLEREHYPDLHPVACEEPAK